MATYLLTWNPKRWLWDNLAQCVARARNGKRRDHRWSCGVNQHILQGDRLFMLRQVEEPRGVFGSGWATSDSYEDEHWDEDAESPTCLYVDLEFDTLLDPNTEPILHRERLQKGALRRVHWNTQASGIEIPEPAATELEALWTDFLHYSNAQYSRQPKQASTQVAHHRGGGFGSPETNAIVEAAAIRFVRHWYGVRGWRVESVERNKCGFDLRCQKGKTVEEVEVKGSAGTTEAFIVTSGEVTQAKTNPNFVLCVVTSATTLKPALTRYSGREFLEGFKLSPTQYRASPFVGSHLRNRRALALNS